MNVTLQPGELPSLLSRLEDRPRTKRILMCTPDFFDITEGINSFMYDTAGNLNRVDRSKAFLQWSDLRLQFEKLGYAVPLIKGQDGLEDMVFCANQSFPFWDRTTNSPAVILSNMRTEKRKPEVAYFQAWYRRQRYAIHHLEDGAFESNGDAVWLPGKSLILAGFGSSEKHRTDFAALEQVARITQAPVVGIELTHADFYHLDTTFCAINEDTCLVYPDGVGDKGMAILSKIFKRILIADVDEAYAPHFACNAFSPDGRHVIIQKTGSKTMAMLEASGFRVIPVDTAEFIKAGGSVYCMKLQVY